MTLLPTAGTRREVDGLDRVICIYLLLPVFLFCFWFTTPFAITLLVLSGCGTYWALSGRNKAPIGIPLPWLVAICAISLAWTAISGVGHYFYANTPGSFGDR